MTCSLRWLLSTALFAATCTAQADGLPRYHVTTFGQNAPGEMIWSLAMNEHEIVFHAGGGDLVTPGKSWMWDGALHPLPALDGYADTYIGGLNRAGALVGSTTTQIGYDWQFRESAFVYQNGTLARLPDQRDWQTTAEAINDHGVIAGAARLPDGSVRGWRFADGHSTLFGLPGEDSSWAGGINNAGEIIGGSWFQTSSGHMYHHAFVYDGVDVVDLNQPDWTNSFAANLNEHGDIVGWFNTSPVDGGGYLYHDGQMTVLPGLGARSLYPRDINDAGAIVGVSADANSHVWAAVYIGGHVYKLADVADQPDLGDFRPVFVDDNGRICGVSTDPATRTQEMMLLTPVPEPSGYLMLGAGLLLVWRRRVRPSSISNTGPAPRS